MTYSGATAQYNPSSQVADAFHETSKKMAVQFPSGNSESRAIDELIDQMREGHLISATFIIKSRDGRLKPLILELEQGPATIPSDRRQTPVPGNQGNASGDPGIASGSGNSGFFRCPHCGKVINGSFSKP